MSSCSQSILSRCRVFVSLSGFGLLFAASAAAQTSFWISPAGGSYSNPMNWQNGVPPQTGNSVFNISSNYTVDIDFDAINTSTVLAATNADIDWIISANSFTISQLKIGSSAGTHNQLSVSGGLLSATFVEVAPAPGQGTLTLGGQVQATYMVVGGQASFPGFFAQTPGGPGTLVIENGAEVHVGGLLADNAGSGSTIDFNGGDLFIHGIGRFNAGASPQSFTRVGDGTHEARLHLLSSILPDNSVIPGMYDFGDETLTIAASSSVEFNSLDGNLRVGNIARESAMFQTRGQFNWLAGNIELTNAEFRIDNNGQFGSTVVLSGSKRMFAPSGTIVTAGSSLSLEGGTLDTSTLTNSGGSFHFDHGVLLLANDNLEIGNNGITNPGGVVIGNSSVISASGELTITDGHSVNLNGGQLIAGRVAGNGPLNFTSGELTIYSGDLTAGPGGQLNPASDLFVGTGSSINLLGGHLQLQAGRNLDIDGGVVSVAGLRPEGSITIENGFLSANRVYVGGSGSNGQMTVEENGSLFSGGMERKNLVINGGTVSIYNDGASFDPAIDASLVGGYTGDSSMTMNGGLAVAPNMIIGASAGFVDTVTINGGMLSTENLVASNGSGSVFIFNGGTIRTGNSFIDGPSRFVVGNGVTDATLELAGGTHTFVDGLEITASGRIVGEGTIIGDVLNSGRISPGFSPGSLEFDGDFQNAGTIEFEIESDLFFDTLTTTDLFQAGGIFGIILAGYAPDAGSEFDLLDFGSFVDVGYGFDFTSASLATGLYWDTSSFGVDGTLRVSAVPEPGPWPFILGLTAFALTARYRVRRDSSRTSNGKLWRSRQLMAGFTGACILLAIVAERARAQGRADTIVQTGQAAPGSGTFSYFGLAVLNDSGETAFSATLTGTLGAFDTGIFRGSGGSITQIVRESQSAPDGNGLFSTFSQLDLNNNGHVAFGAVLGSTSGGSSDNTGIFVGSGSNIVQIARAGQFAPGGNGRFSNVSGSILNNGGRVAFFGFLTETTGGDNDNTGVFLGNGGAITQIAREGQTAPDGNGTFATVSPRDINDAGAVAFFGQAIGTAGGSTDNDGLFRGSGGAITQIVREGQLVPNGNGRFEFFASSDMNNSGTVAFRSSLTGTSGGNSDDIGIFRGSGGAISQIVRAGEIAPDGNGNFSGLGNGRIALNDANEVAFFGLLSNTHGGSNDDSGIFRGNGAGIVQIVREGHVAPDGNGVFADNISPPTMNNSGAVAFTADLSGTVGGFSDNEGIFIGDGIDLLRVARKGDSISGSTIASLDVSSDCINDLGQVAYWARLVNGNETIRRWTPELHWRSATSSTWETADRWTLGLTPAHVHDVFIDSSASVTVTGPASNSTVRSLQVGGGTGLATLSLRNGAVLTATHGVVVQSTGILTGDGVIAANVINNGTILANNLTFNGTLTNNHVIRGNGRIDGKILNANGGRIRALNGDSIWLSGPTFNNAGLIEIHNGSELLVDAQLVNHSNTGMISVRDGSLIADAGLHNAGSMAMTMGDSILQGDINNNGVIQISGGAHATFFDDVVQNGVMQVASVGSTSGTAVILGSFTGSGGFIGGGDVFALGDLRPGNSPDTVLYGGNLFLGTMTDTYIELGGQDPGQFDQMLITGNLNLAGDLFVSLIDGHTLGASQFYLIGDVGNELFGQFNGLGEGSLVGNFGGRDLFITYTGGNGNDIGLFTAIPEPQTAGLLVCMLFVMWRPGCRRRRE